MNDDLDDATTAIERGDLVVYPTETVYGLGADALDPDAVERVFEAKDRDRSKAISMAVPDIETALEYVEPTDRERRFLDEFLPGPITVVVARTAGVPDVLTADRDRVGLRIPDHEIALALLERVAPLTATSANVSGRPSARRVADLDPEIREAATAVVDSGETPGGGSTVVDIETGEIIRRGAMADTVADWLAEQ